MDRELSMIERARVQMHLLVCAACRNFNEQMQLLRQAMRQLTPPQDSQDSDQDGAPK
jgi:predicted anti-sigma-YlaC factor YlaD